MARKIFFLILGLSISIAYAQGLKLYGLVNTTPTPGTGFTLVQVDPFTADTTALYDIPQTFAVGVGASTYDQNNRRYIFWGVDQSNTDRYYAASVDSAFYVNPPIQGRPPIELQYDLQADVTYGLVWDQVSSTEYLVKVDLQTGQLYDSLALPGVQFISLASSGFNSNTHRYFFVGTDQSMTKRLYYVNALTGQIIAQPALPQQEYYRALQFDLTTNTLYGLLARTDSSVSQNVGGFPQYLNETFLVTVDTLTGQYALVDSMPVLSGFMTGIAVGSIDFDQASQTFVMVARDDTSDLRLMLINVNNGQVYSDVQYPTLVYELECDNRVFALKKYKGEDSTVTSITSPSLTMRMYPNPTYGELTVEVDASFEAETVSVYDPSGRLVRERIWPTNSSRMRLDMRQMTPGVYWVILTNSEGWQESMPIVLSGE